MITHPRVLIVDDEAPLRRQVMLGLAQHGYEVDECEEGISALSKIKAAESRHNPFGCVILDVRLPDIDGLKILSVLKATYSDLPVVVITGYGTEDTVNTVHSHGGSVYLDKPFDMTDLVSEIERLMPKVDEQPAPQASVKVHVLTSAMVFLRGTKDADLTDMYSKLYLGEGVCYCDPVIGEWDIVLLVQGQDRKSISETVARQVESLKDVEAFEVHYCERPKISKDLEEFIQDYEKVQAMGKTEGGTMDGRNLRMLTSYAILDVDPWKLSSLYMKLYFADNVVHCDVTDEGRQIILLLQGTSSQEILNTIRNEIRMMAGVLRIKQLNTLNFSAK
jgi:FixJ family two-component response regulator